MNQLSTNLSIWGDHTLPTQPRLEGCIDADACVVGLGGSGLEAIDELLALDKKVVGIDAGSVANGAAGRNGGFLLAGLAGFYPEVVHKLGRNRARKIYEMTLAQIERMKKHVPGCVRDTGSLRIEDESDFLDWLDHMRALRADGFTAEVYKGTEGRGLLLPTDAAFDPVQYCRESMQQVLAAGAQLFQDSPAIRIKKGAVYTPRGKVSCDHIIVAIDGRLEELFPTLREKVTTYRLQMLATEPETGVHFDRPTYLRSGYDYFQQLPNGRIAMGGCRDRHVTSEATASTQPTEPVQTSIEASLRRMGVQAKVTHRWAASVAFTHSGLPIVQRLADDTALAVGAYSGTGNLIGRIAGRGAAQALVHNDWSTLDLITKEP